MTMNENKAAFVEALGEALAAYSELSGVQRLAYSKDPDGFEAVTIYWNTGGEHTVNVTCDSCAAIMHDIYKALL